MEGLVLGEATAGGVGFPSSRTAPTSGVDSGVGGAISDEAVGPQHDESTGYESTRRYLEALYGDDTGVVAMALGTGSSVGDNGSYTFGGFQQDWFQWPGQAEELTAEIARRAHDGDVYVCVSLMKTSKRTPGNAVILRLLHADVDNGALQLDQVRALGGWAVASGTLGNGHVYVPLSQPVSPEQYTKLQRALKNYLGADSKIAANDLLRPAGTRNYKSAARCPGAEPTPVEFLLEPGGSAFEPDVVAQILGTDLSGSTIVSPAPASHRVGLSEDAQEVNLEDEKYRLVRRALEEVSNPSDRSADTMRVVARCYDSGLTLAQTRWAVNTRVDLAERIDERDDDDVQRCWLRIDRDRRDSLQHTGERQNRGTVDDFETRVRSEVSALRIRDEARKRLQAEKRSPAEPFDAGLLKDILDRPHAPAFRVSGICPSDGGTLIVAQRKTGKTTLTLNLARCLLTGVPFLDRFPVNEKVTGRVALLNYEVSGSLLARWAADARVPGERLLLVNLRGRRNPLGDAEDRDRLAELLREHEVESLIVDPFGRAFTGASQNDSGEVGTWLQDLDVFSRSEVGARDVILTAHAGWQADRTRGSSALEDWADSVVTLTTNKEKQRFIRAFGRDVDVDEDRLEFEPASRTLVTTGSGGQTQTNHAAKIDKLVGVVCEFVSDNPDCTAKAIAGIKGYRDEDVREALKKARASGVIERTDLGPGKGFRHRLAGGGPT